MHISVGAHGIAMVHSSISIQSISSETPGWHEQTNDDVEKFPVKQLVPFGQLFKLVEQTST